MVNRKNLVARRNGEFLDGTNSFKWIEQFHQVWFTPRGFQFGGWAAVLGFAALSSLDHSASTLPQTPFRRESDGSLSRGLGARPQLSYILASKPPQDLGQSPNRPPPSPAPAYVSELGPNLELGHFTLIRYLSFCLFFIRISSRYIKFVVVL